MKRLFLMSCLAFALPAALWASSTGPPSGHAGDPPANNNCTQCHTGTVNSGSGSVEFSFPVTEYVPGETIVLSVLLADPDQARWGFQAIAKDGADNPVGSFTSTDNNTQLNSSYINHTAAGTAPGTTGSNSWTFDWTAPNSDIGEIFFYVAGNAANNNGSTSGDNIYTSSASLTAAATNQAPLAFSLLEPIDAEVLDATDPINFLWAASSDPDGDPISYELQSDTDQSFANPSTHFNGSDTMAIVEPGSFELNTSYWWRVIASDGNGASTTSSEQWSFSVDNFDAVGDEPGTIEGWQLSAAWPNPFNSRSHVQLTLPDQSEVHAAVYDLLGREVALLQQGVMNAGQHRLAFDGGELPAGVYLLRVQAGGEFRATRKLVYMK